MKTRKRKLTSLLKTGILLFGISFLLWNCEQESIIEEQQIVVEDTINPLFTEFRSQFNYNSFEETIPYQYEVNWAYSTKQHSEDLQTNFYEFDLIYVDAFNPIRINKIGPKKHNIVFKLVAVESQDQEYDFYIAKFFQEKASGISIDVLQPSLNTETGYTGVTHLYNSNNDIVFAKFVSTDNNENLRKYVDPIFKKKTDNDLKEFKESFVYVTKCETVTIHQYIDWYYYEFDDWSNIVNSYYSHTTYAGSSTTEECTTEWVPHPHDYGEGGLFGTGVGCDEAGECIEDVVDAIDDDYISNELTGKAKCVYDKMTNNNNSINWIISNFKDTNTPSEFNLKFVMSTSLGNETNATTVKSGNTFIIKINQNTLSDRTALGLARSILHEGIHARLREFAVRDGSNESSFPGIYDYWRRFKKNWDHQQMANHYRETIAKGLKQYDDGQHLDSFYNALAWEGLANIKDANNEHDEIYTEAWKELSPNEQQEVLDIIREEKQNVNKICQ